MLGSLIKLVPQSLLSIEQQRLSCLAIAPEGALKDYLSAPFPDKEECLEHLDVVALDFETTGLHAVKDQLLSIGCVNLDKGKIKLNTCHHEIIRTVGQLQKQNVCIHLITDAEKERGEELKAAVDKLLRIMAGKPILVHYARIERGFLQEACRQIYGLVPPFMIIDTLAIIKRRFDQKDTAYDPSQLRLGNLRDSFRLPSYHAHNALKDAIATAELLLAELKTNHDGLQTPLKKLL
ncbi:MAG: exonuclease domain-containing protein [Pseudomonadota bacterium]